MAPIPRVFRITGTCNNYPWGKKGRDSFAAQLAAKSNEDFVIKDDEPYSEIWFGDYPDFPARVHATGELLSDTINENHLALLGENVMRTMDAQLPYLPKVCALPIGTHELPLIFCLGSLDRQRPATADSPGQAARRETSPGES